MADPPVLNLGVLISGNGSNLQAIIDRIADGSIDARINIVVSNEADAYGLERARRAALLTQVLDHKQFADRAAYDAALAAILEQAGVELIVLAGFMRILSPAFVERFSGRIINIHPSLLPKYPGLNTHQRVLAAGDQEHGASVHFVNNELDAGPIIIQRRVPVMAGDTPEALQQRVHKVEHQILPQAIQWFAQNRLQIRDDQVLLDGAHKLEQGLAP